MAPRGVQELSSLRRPVAANSTRHSARAARRSRSALGLAWAIPVSGLGRLAPSSFEPGELVEKYAYYVRSIVSILTGFRKPWRIVRLFFERTPRTTPFPVALRRDGSTFLIRGRMDVWALKETFLDRFYGRYGAFPRDGWNVIDIGGGIGDFTIWAARDNPRSRVAAYEPFTGSRELLEKNVALNHLTNISVHGEAVTDRSGHTAVDTTRGDPGKFITVGNLDGVANHDTPTISLGDVLDRHEMARCDLLKLDCEGAEYPILMGAPDEVLERLDRIVMEYHDDILPGHTYRELRAFLQSKAFRVEHFASPVHANIGYLRAQRV